MVFIYFPHVYINTEENSQGAHIMKIDLVVKTTMKKYFLFLRI